MIYAISDIHGQYNQFMRILEIIKFNEKDTLYVVGDVVDRGPHPIKILQYMMERPNIIPIIGNHELMAYDGLKLLLKEITEESIHEMDEQSMELLADWIRNGAMSTISEFRALSHEERVKIMDYLGEFSAYEEVKAGGKDYLLVHAGIADFDPSKDLAEYALDDFLWTRTDYEIPYFEDRYTISGHTPTQGILGNTRPGYIFRANNHIAIDCGACHRNGRLAAFCLETEEEFYSRE